jgi:hypothetical protein
LKIKAIACEGRRFAVFTPLCKKMTAILAITLQFANFAPSIHEHINRKPRLTEGHQA